LLLVGAEHFAIALQSKPYHHELPEEAHEMEKTVVVALDATAFGEDPGRIARDVADRLGLPIRFAYLLEGNGGAPAAGGRRVDAAGSRRHLGDVLVEER
jgi:hypothetical protein